jgi:AAA15 family ATPase/GTPase
METYTLTANDVKLEVFRDLIDELREVRKTQEQSGETENTEILDTLEVVFGNCFNRTKDSMGVLKILCKRVVGQAAARQPILK